MRSARLTARLSVVTGLVVLGAASRLLPHPPNFTPVTAIALFGGASLPRRWQAFLVPLASFFASDLILGFHDQMPGIYGSMLLIAALGRALQGRRRPLAVAAAALLGSVLFFVVSNLGVWAAGSLYPRTGAGLVACFVAAVPFFGPTLLGDLLYTAALFGGLALAERLTWPAVPSWPTTKGRSATRPPIRSGRRSPGRPARSGW